LKFSDDDKNSGYGYEYCCYLEDGEECNRLTKYQYNHIKDYAKIMCLMGSASEYAKISLLTIFIIIIILL
jgi:hypothetical protein